MKLWLWISKNFTVGQLHGGQAVKQSILTLVYLKQMKFRDKWYIIEEPYYRALGIEKETGHGIFLGVTDKHLFKIRRSLWVSIEEFRKCLAITLPDLIASVTISTIEYNERILTYFCMKYSKCYIIDILEYCYKIENSCTKKTHKTNRSPSYNSEKMALSIISTVL